MLTRSFLGVTAKVSDYWGRSRFIMRAARASFAAHTIFMLSPHAAIRDKIGRCSRHSELSADDRAWHFHATLDYRHAHEFLLFPFQAMIYCPRYRFGCQHGIDMILPRYGSPPTL